MGVLSGTTVLDASRLMAGPYAAMLLAHLGARVIKVEPPGGEEGRSFGPPFYQGDGMVFMAANRGKESVCLNLRTPGGREVFERLVGQSDVFIHNFRPDFVEKQAIDYETLRRLRSDLIYCGISAYGEDGPNRLKPSVDSVIQGVAGIFYSSGEESDPPIRVGLPIIDVTTGIYAALGIVAAIMQRKSTGKGQKVETILLETALNFMAARIGESALEGREPAREINLPMAVPSRHFEAADGRYFSISVVNDKAFRRFCRVVDRADWLEDPRYDTNANRVANRRTFLQEVAELFRTRPAAEWVAAFDEADIPCSPANSVMEVLADPLLADRLVHHPGVPGLPLVGLPIHLSAGMHSATDLAPPPPLGQHTDLVLGELGYSTAEVAAFRTRGDVGGK